MKFKEYYPPIELNEIESIEGRYGLSIPEAYKNHLLRFNGGSPEPDIFSFIEKGERTDSRVMFFYAIGSKSYDDFEDAVCTYKIEEKRMPNSLIPFAEDPFGNVLCISSGSNDYGFIYFWNHEEEIDYSVSDDKDDSNLYFVSNNFDDFLASLRVICNSIRLSNF